MPETGRQHLEAMPSLLVQITDEQAAWLDSQCDRLRPKSRLIRDLIDTARQGLTGVATLPAYCVGAEEGLGNAGAKAKPANAASNPSPASSLSQIESISPMGRGQGIGRGSGGNPREGGVKAAKAKSPLEQPFRFTSETDFSPPTVKQDYSALLPAKEEILGFWEAKSGSVTLRAWNGLLRECEKIRADAAGGMAVLKDELTKAAERGQQGIDHARWMAYGANRFAKSNAPAQPEMRHPASRVFQGGRFIDEEGPTTNPVLKDLF